MKDIILKYINDKFGENKGKGLHFSYCLFPAEKCTCKYVNKIEYDTPLISEGYIDSFSMVMVLIFLQKTFNIKISDKDAIPENFNTIYKMEDLVKKYKNL
jgi:acyl carrier protein